jgi:hypothetical protein
MAWMKAPGQICEEIPGEMGLHLVYKWGRSLTDHDVAAELL